MVQKNRSDYKNITLFCMNGQFKSFSYKHLEDLRNVIHKVGNNSFIADEVILGDNITLHFGCRIGYGSQIGDRANLGSESVIKPICKIGDGVFLSHHTTIGNDSKLEENVFIGKHCIIGKRCTVKQNAHITEHVHILDNSTVEQSAFIEKSFTYKDKFCKIQWLGFNKVMFNDAEYLVSDLINKLSKKIENGNVDILETMNQLNVIKTFKIVDKFSNHS